MSLYEALLPGPAVPIKFKSQSKSEMKHLQTCGETDCGRCAWIKHEEEWRTEFKWLDMGKSLDYSGRGGIGCKLCSAFFASIGKNTSKIPSQCLPYCQYTIRKNLRRGRFERHTNSNFHKESGKVVSGNIDTSQFGAPSVEEFKELLQHVVRHGSIHGGLPRIGRAHKLHNIALSLFEAAKRRHQI